jgi:hypothetical protein
LGNSFDAADIFKNKGALDCWMSCNFGYRAGKSDDLSTGPIDNTVDFLVWAIQEALRFEKIRNLVEKNRTQFTIGSVCTGTGAPEFALEALDEAFRMVGHARFLTYTSAFACEIEPSKQAFFRRNHGLKVIFRDVVDLGEEGADEA